jgi:outer membrane protein OmpA-like peptidoglycan-associated protein
MMPDGPTHPHARNGHRRAPCCAACAASGRRCRAHVAQEVLGAPSGVVYSAVAGQEYGWRWKSRRPPGLPPSARRASARGAALPFVEQIARQQTGGEVLVRVVKHLCETESGGTLALPAHTFDARPQAHRPSGKPRITAWGAFQFNAGAWQSLPGVARTAVPWDATAEDELSRPIRRYTSLFASVRDAGGSELDAARAVRLWHRTPAGYRAYLSRGRPAGFAAAWAQVDAAHRTVVDRHLRAAGILGGSEGELAGEAEALESEIDRKSPSYVRWVQQSLNQVLRLQLAVDGVIGSQTQKAIVAFQRREGLAADGVVGSATEAALLAAGAATPPGLGALCHLIEPKEILEAFDQGSAAVKPAHQTKLSQLALCVRDSQKTARPIRCVHAIGHASVEGDAAFNDRLGRQRAEQVRVQLTAALDRVLPGLSRQVEITTDTRGESQPRNQGAPKDRRVELFIPVAPRAARGCPPFTSRIRLHLKILVPPTRFSIETMLCSMRQVYAPAGFLVEVASTERLNLTNLEELDVFCPGNPNVTCCPFPCASNGLNPEHVELFTHRNNVGVNDIAVYFVRKTEPGLNGCCAHPPGRTGVVVAATASQWSLAHEVGHVLGLPHVDPLTRLMTGGGTDNIQEPPPDIVAPEVQTMDGSALTVPC